jgi:universal stress protein A
MTYQTLLVAQDFSESGSQALQKAVELADGKPERLHVLHVVDYLPPVDTTFGAVSPFEVDLTDEMVESAKTRLSSLAATHGIPEDHCWVEVGSPKVEIIRVAGEIHADLIVVGSHGRHGLGLLLGSTASSVIHHAACDVLAVRARET